MRGVFRSRPSLPRYSVTWDPQLVLTLLRSWGPTALLMLKQLSFKLVALLALCQPKRVSELAAFDVDFLHKSPIEWVFHLPRMTKTHKVGQLPDMAVYARFPSDLLLCPVTTLMAYLDRTASFRQSTSALLLSYCQPHRPVSAQTLSRWLTTLLAAAGIDTSVFKAHSTRSAATSKAAATGFSIAQILAAGCWSDKSNTFAMFYCRTVENTTPFSTHLIRCSFKHAV